MSLIFLIAVGLALIFGVLGVLNLAHGSFYALGAYIAATLINFYSGNIFLMYLSILIAAGLVAIIGLGLENSVFRVIYEREEVYQLLLTFGLILVFEDVIRYIWGTGPYSAPGPYTVLGHISVPGGTYPIYALLVTVVGAVVFVTLLLFMRSKLGKIILVVAENKSMAASLGINTRTVYIIVFLLGSFLAGLGGSMTIPLLTALPGISLEVLVLAFAVIIISGVRSITGLFLISILVSVIRTLSIVYVPEIELALIYIIVIAVLLIRPQGLFTPR